jgi:hypothetical protein
MALCTGSLIPRTDLLIVCFLALRNLCYIPSFTGGRRTPICMMISNDPALSITHPRLSPTLSLTWQNISHRIIDSCPRINLRFILCSRPSRSSVPASYTMFHMSRLNKKCSLWSGNWGGCL